MTIQEKSLVAAFGVLLALTLAYFGVQKMLLAKGREYDDTRTRLTNDLRAQERENRQAEGAARTLRGWTALTFDQDELRRILAFITGGGLDRARERELEDLKEARRAAVPTSEHPASSYELSQQLHATGHWLTAAGLVGLVAEVADAFTGWDT